MKKHNQGFVVPLLIAIIAVLAIGVGVYVYENNKAEFPIPVNNNSAQNSQDNTKTSNLQTVTNTQVTETQNNVSNSPKVGTVNTQISEWKTYTNIKQGITFKYPSNYLSKEQSIIDTVNNIPLELQLVEDANNTHLFNFVCDKNRIIIEVTPQERRTYIPQENYAYVDPQTKTMIDGQPVSVYRTQGGLTTLGCDGKIQLSTKSTWLKKNGMYYIITVAQDDKNLDSVFNNVISTFKFIPISGTNNNVNSIVVPGMQQYTDSTFGFMFWYPNTWAVTQKQVTDPTDNGWFQNGTVVKTLSVADPNNAVLGVTIQEFQSSSMAITELGHTKNLASPVGVDQKYYFDPSVHTWMYEGLTDTPNGLRPAGTITAADVSNNTMGGLHIFAGAKRFGSDSIVPLSATHFLVISTNDVGGYTDQKYLVHTIVATDTSVATPVSINQQTQTVQAEASAYNVKSANLTPAQVFQEVASQFNLVRSNVEYFRIWDQDKVQYNYGLGTNFAYKLGGTWHLVGTGNSQSGQSCSELSSVPAQYNPGCYDTATAKSKYVNVNTDGSSSSMNYPPAQMYSYIGQ